MNLFRIIPFLTIVAVSEPAHYLDSRDSNDLGSDDYPGGLSK